MSGERGQRDLTSLKVGMAVLIGMALLAYGLLWGQDLLRTGQNLRVSVVFDSGFGLSTGDPVTVAGVKKGQVEEIQLTLDNHVVVLMRLDDDVRLNTASLFTIEAEGIIGARYVNITGQVGGRALADGDTLYGVNAASLSDVFRNMQVLMVEVSELTRVVQSIITDEEVRTRIATAFNNFNRTIDLLNSIVSDNQDIVRQSIADLGTMVQNVNQVLADNADDLNSALKSIDGAGVEFGKTAGTIDSLSGTLVVLTQRLAEGQGTIWRLAESDSLYFEFRTTLSRLDSLIADIKANPRKYFTVKIF